jgi:hypothetical protein
MNFDNLVAVLAVAAAVPLILTAVPLVPVPGPVLRSSPGSCLALQYWTWCNLTRRYGWCRRSDWRSCSSSPAWRSTSATFAGLAPAWPD